MNAITTSLDNRPRVLDAASFLERDGRSLAPSLRIPPRPGNRAYLRALRAAEAAAWEAHDGQAAVGERVPSRLPVADDRSEGRWHAGLGLVASAAVGYGLWTTGLLAEQWCQLSALVQRIVG